MLRSITGGGHRDGDGDPARTAPPGLHPTLPTIKALLTNPPDMGSNPGRAPRRTLEYSLPLNMAITPKMSLLTAGEAQNKHRPICK